MDADLDQLTADCENLESEVVEIQKTTNALSDQADDLREVRLRCSYLAVMSENSDTL